MRKLFKCVLGALLVASVLVGSGDVYARGRGGGHGSSGGRHSSGGSHAAAPASGSKHTESHGGSYQDGRGSSHKGGSYKSTDTGDHYRKHK